MKSKKLSNMNQHFRTHDGQKPYHCHLCDMKYTQSGNLQYHYVKTHPGQDQRLKAKVDINIKHSRAS